MVDNFARAGDPQTAPELLAVLAMNDDLRIALSAVENPSLPAWALHNVVQKREEPALIAAVLTNPNWNPVPDREFSLTKCPRPPRAPNGVMDPVLPCTWKDSLTENVYVWLNADQEPMVRASVLSRIVFYVIDCVFAIVAVLVVAMPFAFLAVATENEDFWRPVITVTVYLTFLAYWAVSYRIWGQTIGMRMGGLVVISKTTGQRLSWGRAWLRTIVLWLHLIVPFGLVIWWSTTGGSQWRQGPHDFAAKSIVVMK